MSSNSLSASVFDSLLGNFDGKLEVLCTTVDSYVRLNVQPTHPDIARLPASAVRIVKNSTSIQLSPESVAKSGHGVQNQHSNKGLQQQSQVGGGVGQGDCRGAQDSDQGGNQGQQGVSRSSIQG